MKPYWVFIFIEPLPFNKFVYMVFSKYNANAESLFPREFSEFNGELRQKMNAIVHNLNILMLPCGLVSWVWAFINLSVYSPAPLLQATFLMLFQEDPFVKGKPLN